MHYYTSTAYHRRGIFDRRRVAETSLTVGEDFVRGITRGVTFNVPAGDITDVFTERHGIFGCDLIIETKYTVYRLRRLKAPRRAREVIQAMIER